MQTKRNPLQRGLILLETLAFLILLTRALSHQEIDDVTPGIPCEEALLEKVEILWVIPLFNNESIATNQTWCAHILALNKTLGLHGVYHTYREFYHLRNEAYLQPGIQAFQDCFNQTPVLFKAPQLALSPENKAWLSHRYQIKNKLNQGLHKVYHCNDTGNYPNALIRYL